MTICIQVEIPDSVVQILLQNGLMIGTAFTSDKGDFTSTIWNITPPCAQITYLWDTQSGLYVSNAKIAAGTLIPVLASQDEADTGKTYPYQSSGTFGSPCDSAPSGDIGVANQSSDTMAFGLLQQVTINNDTQEASPIIITPVSAGQQVNIPAITKINVFIASDMHPYTVITSIPQPSIAVNTAQHSFSSLFYDGNTWSKN